MYWYVWEKGIVPRLGTIVMENSVSFDDKRSAKKYYRKRKRLFVNSGFMYVGAVRHTIG